ncbi:hypothetical protein AB205_0134380, partial [Aquarana catesbeiana]
MFYQVCFSGMQFLYFTVYCVLLLTIFLSSGTPFSFSTDLFILTATLFAPMIYKAVTPVEGRRSDLLLPFAVGCPHASAYINYACMPIIRSGWMKGGILMVGIPTDQSFFRSAHRLHEKKKITIYAQQGPATYWYYTRMMPAGL